MFFRGSRTKVARVALTVTTLFTFAHLQKVRADVRGQLQIGDGFRSFAYPVEELPEPRRRFVDEWNGFVAQRSAPVEVAREVSVVLRGEGTPATETPPVRLQNGTLLPATIVVRAGGTLQIQNDDGIRYELSAEGVADFQASATEPGHARQIQTPTPGSFPIRDRNLTHVRGHLHVVPNLIARAFVENNGSFVFRGVAAGTYTLHVYLGEREVVSGTQVVVSDESQELEPIRVADAQTSSSQLRPSQYARAALEVFLFERRRLSVRELAVGDWS